MKILIAIAFYITFSIASANAATTPPMDYLVPRSSDIPDSLVQFKGRIYEPCSDDSYIFEFMIGTANPVVLTMSEIPDSSQANYQGNLQGYAALISASRPGKSHEKVKDIEHLGAQGTLFHNIEYNQSSYDLIMNDKGRYLRIQTTDTPKFHFTEEMVLKIIYGLERQQSDSSPFCRSLSDLLH